MNKLSEREKELGYCEEAQTYCSVAEERYKQGRADERKAFEDIEMGLSKEDKRRVLNDFGNWLSENGYDSSCHNIKAWITEYENRDKKEQK